MFVKGRKAESGSVTKIRPASLRRDSLTVSMLSAGALALLGTSGAANAEPNKTSSPLDGIVVFGNDPCPLGTDGEIVVCARQPESERYRIPKALRQHKAAPIMERSWAARTASADAVSQAILPDSCSAIGSYGQTGCTMQMLRQWFAERRASQSAGN